MSLAIVDTTLRDGEQRPGVALRICDKVYIARLLETLGVAQIEAGTPAMGGEEKKSIKKIVELGLKSKISAWNRMSLGDIKQSIDCGVQIIHISVPASDLQIKTKLGKDREWVLENMKKCIAYAAEKGFHVTIGLEDASRADFRFLLKIIAVALLEGVRRVRYADTVGIQYREKVYRDILKIKDSLDIKVEMHAHNDLGMAVANSLSAVKAGAEYIDCTIGGIGERAGNCDYIQFMASGKRNFGLFKDFNAEYAKAVQNEIMGIMKRIPGAAIY